LSALFIWDLQLLCKLLAANFLSNDRLKKQQSLAYAQSKRSVAKRNSSFLSGQGSLGFCRKFSS